VRSAGGTPEPIAKVGPGEYARSLPQVLPGSKAILFTLQKTPFRWDDAQIVVRSLADGSEKALLSDAADARYLPTGHLLFVRRGKLMAVPFALDRLALTGAPVAVVDDVMQATNTGNTYADSGAGQFSASAQGSLVYVTGGVQPIVPIELVWVDRDTGTPVPVGVPHGAFGGPRLSPDGRRILMFSGASAGNDASRLWVYDTVRGTHTAITSRDERIAWGIWAPNADRIVYQRLEAGRGTLYVRPSDGTGSAAPVAEARATYQTPGSWSRNGRLAYVEFSSATSTDIRVLDMTTPRGADTVAVQTAASDGFPEFSPNGAWLAYASDVSGRSEVYVQPFPGPGPRVLVSTSGGTAPTWRADGRELYYSWGSNGRLHMFAVPLTVAGTTLTAGTPKELFAGPYGITGPVRG
jgi:serine/threonine-protein kinase